MSSTATACHLIWLLLTASLVLAGTRTPVGSCNSRSGGASMIVNGELVQPGEAAHQLALFRGAGASRRFICSASLIAPRTAVSAAHCIDGYELDPTVFLLRYGTLNVSTGRTITIQRIIKHPAFTAASFHFDVAILTLSERIIIDNTTVGMIEIASKEPEEGSRMQVTGWGQTGSNAPGSEFLLRAELTRWKQSDCVQRWSREGHQPITETMFCASSEKQSSCKGDSGGPVTQDGKLVGIVSWGSEFCLDSHFPNVFVNLAVEDVKEWIDLNVIW